MEFRGKQLVMWLVPAGLVLALVVILALVFRPAAVVERALVRLGEAETAAFRARLLLENNTATQEILGEEGHVEFALDGVWRRDGRGGRHALVSDVDVTTKTDSVSVAISGEARFIDDQVYFFVERSPRIFPALVALKDQWLSVPRGGSPAGEVAGTRSDMPAEFFVSVDRVGTEEIDGVITVKYQTVVGDEAVVRMMDSMADLFGTQLTATQIADIRASVAMVGALPVEVWVDRWSQNVRQLSSVLAVPGGNTVRFTLILDDLNKQVAILVPEGATSLAEVVGAVEESGVETE